MTLFSSLYTGRLDRELGTDDSTTLFTTARRKSAVNEAQDQWAELTECLQRQSTLAMTGGTAEYNLNSTTVIADGDYVRLSKEQVQFVYTDASSYVTVLAGDDLPRREVEWLNRYEAGWQVSTVASSVMQMPDAYYERADGGAKLLGFWPTPSTGSSASMKAIIPYVAKPSPMTSDTNEPFTVSGSVRGDLRPYHQGLVHFAAHLLEKLRRDDQASDRQLQTFLGYVQRYWQNTRVKNGTSLTFTRSYFTRATNDDDRRDPRT